MQPPYHSVVRHSVNLMPTSPQWRGISAGRLSIQTLSAAFTKGLAHHDPVQVCFIIVVEVITINLNQKLTGL